MQPIGQQFEGNRCAQHVNGLRRITDDDEAVGCSLDEFFAGVRRSASFDQPTVRGDLVSAVNGDVEALDLAIRLDSDTEFARHLLGAWRRGDTPDVDRSTCDRRKQKGNRRAGTEPDCHAVLDQLRGSLGSGLLLSISAHRLLPSSSMTPRAVATSRASSVLGEIMS